MKIIENVVGLIGILLTNLVIFLAVPHTAENLHILILYYLTFSLFGVKYIVDILKEDKIGR